eukprot:scaffold115643_cov38-Prasinocladus_malaysianus.AAC.1
MGDRRQITPEYDTYAASVGRLAVRSRVPKADGAARHLAARAPKRAGTHPARQPSIQVDVNVDPVLVDDANLPGSSAPKRNLADFTTH